MNEEKEGARGRSMRKGKLLVCVMIYLGERKSEFKEE
jgi:hypothetical protein